MIEGGGREVFTHSESPLSGEVLVLYSSLALELPDGERDHCGHL